MELHLNMTVVWGVTYQMLLRPFRHPSTFRSFDRLGTTQARGTAGSGTELNGLIPAKKYLAVFPAFHDDGVNFLFPMPDGSRFRLRKRPRLQAGIVRDDPLALEMLLRVTQSAFPSLAIPFAFDEEVFVVVAEGEASAKKRRAAKSSAAALIASASTFASVTTSISGRRSPQNQTASSCLMYGAATTMDLLAERATFARSFRHPRLSNRIISEPRAFPGRWSRHSSEPSPTSSRSSTVILSSVSPQRSQSSASPSLLKGPET